jgi:hypothetical protein
VQDLRRSDVAPVGIDGHPSPEDGHGIDLSSNAVGIEIRSEETDSRVPKWLVLGLIVMAGSAAYTVLAYLVWLWAS